VVAEARRVESLRSQARSSARRALHAGAWLAWLAAACVAVFLTSNPLYLSLGFLAACGVYLNVWDAPKRRALGPFVALGLLFALLSVPFNVLTGSSGWTVLATLPQVAFPRSFGGVTFGGAITAEALVTAIDRALGIATLVMVAAAFNAAVDHLRLLRLSPRSLSQVMMVFTVAVLAVPQGLKQARAVTEARRLRGRGMRGFRAVPSLMLPVLQGALERSVQRAESLDARGFGAGASRGGWPASLGGAAGLGLCCWGAFAHFYYGANIVSSVAIAAGAAVVALALLRSGGTKQRRLVRDRWHARDWLVLASALAGVLCLLALRISGAGDANYLAYPRVASPGFHPVGVVAFLLLLAPVVVGTAQEEAV
jgi:energy-coupling factor transport system permease protein